MTQQTSQQQPTADNADQVVRQPIKVQHTSRVVIQDQLLAALDDKTKVAILATRQDVDLMIDALQDYRGDGGSQLLKDLRYLRRCAFEHV